MTSVAGAGGGVGSGSGGGAYFAVALLFVFGFSLEDSAEAGDEWTHCLFFGRLGMVGGRRRRRRRWFFFPLSSTTYYGVGMEAVMRSRCWFPPTRGR